MTAHGVRRPIGTRTAPRRKRTVRRKRHIHLTANGNELPLVLPIERVIVILHGDKRSKSVVPCRKLHIVELIPVHRRRPERTHLARPDKPIERLHGLFDGRGCVKTVNDIQIKIIRPEPPERALDLACDRLFFEVSLVEVNLGGNDHFVSGNVFLQRPAEIFFTRPRRIGIGGIKKVDSEPERMADDRLASLGIERPCVHFTCRIAEAHAPKAQA